VVTAGENDGVESPGAPAPATPLPATQVRRRFTLKRVLVGVGVFLLLAIAVGAAWAYVTVQRSLAQTTGSARLEGLSANATVTRDTYGVTHIEAANIHDLYAAEGYVHAQDRLFQMFYFRALGEGRFAEAFGQSAVSADIFLRTIGLRRAAEEDLKVLSPDVRQALEAYSSGVNAFVHSHSDRLPLEFQIAGLKFEDWQPLDTLAFGKVMAWDLGNNWDGEIMMNDLVKKVGAERAAQLMPGYPQGAPVSVPGGNSGSAAPALAALREKVAPWIPSMGLEGLGSNNWVVDGSKSVTGKPLLSNDPHLSVQNPSIWYQVQLRTTDGSYDVAGFSFAGAPGIVTGHNQKIAWGVTNSEGDVEDLFVENLDPAAHPGQYLTPGGWEPLRAITESIQVKGGQPVTHTVRITRHGPLLTDALEAISSTLGVDNRAPWALQWTAASGGHLFEAVYGLQRASNWQEFRQALSKWDVPGQNFVYADTEGNIGYQLTGLQPIRKQGNGKVPAEGWTGAYDWTGMVPFDDLPRAYNPPEHFIATANNRPFAYGYKYPIEGVWAPPWRITRIKEMLASKDKLSEDDFKAMLLDWHSPLARKVGALLAGLKPQDAKAQEAVKLFQGWDGNLAPDSTQAAIYEVTVTKALSETYADELGAPLLAEYIGTAGSISLQGFEALLASPDDPLWDRTTTSATERRDDVLTQSLTDAVTDLKSAFGDDITQSTWGRFHTIAPKHTFGSQPVISAMFNLQSLPFGGDGTTVSVAGFDLFGPFDMRTYQSYRMIVDLGDFGKSVGVFAGGDSGQPFSKYWAQHFPDWQKGDMYPMVYSKEALAANTDAVLTLTP
jgi:penicillin amidase